MIELDNQTGFALDVSLLNPLYEAVATQDVELILMDDNGIRELNREYRGKDAPTDVLSFPVEPFPEAPLGTIVISVETAEKQGADHGHDTATEIRILFLHGLLHLLGYDHETDHGEMVRKESQLRQQFGLPLSLTERNL